MKKVKTSDVGQSKSDELLPEYKFDYRQARPNRFVARLDRERLVVALDADVSKVFTTPEAVNNALRALIAVVPERPKRSRAR